jgi:hypothetical protein
VSSSVSSGPAVPAIAPRWRPWRPTMLPLYQATIDRLKHETDSLAPIAS